MASITRNRKPSNQPEQNPQIDKDPTAISSAGSNQQGVPQPAAAEIEMA
jgi:hypothetical protein